MGLSSIFKRKPIQRDGESVAVNEPADEVQRARTRARQRLIGAVVLLAIGIVGFPLVFETQPRPIPVDIPIEIPRKDLAPLLLKPSTKGAAAPLAPAPAPAETQEAPVLPSPPDDMITESRDEAAGGASRAAVKPTLNPTVKPGSDVRAEARPESRPETSEDGARARALLDGKPAVSAEAARFIVQVGAFADATAAHDARSKIEKLGMKTYTQVASTPAGNRIRVRLGPFTTRDEADKALAKARGAGLSAVVLTL